MDSGSGSPAGYKKKDPTKIRDEGFVGGYYPFSFPRNRERFYRACVLFDRVELFLPNLQQLMYPGLGIPEYERKRLRGEFDAYRQFVAMIAPLVEAEVVEVYVPSRDGAIPSIHEIHDEGYWWNLGTEPFVSQPLNERQWRDRLRSWWPVVAGMQTEKALVPFTDEPTAHEWYWKRLVSAQGDAFREIDQVSAEIQLKAVELFAPHLTPF